MDTETGTFQRSLVTDLPTWDADLRPLMEGNACNLLICGQRKVGKSYLTSRLLTMLAEQGLADLVILACGGSGPYSKPMAKYFDPRFCFSEWPVDMFDVLWRQQGELIAAGRKRSVVIIIDDINMNSSARDAIITCDLRGRLRNISLIKLCISWTLAPKVYRRSVDAIFLFNLPLSSDKECLSREYSSFHSWENTYFLIENLEPHHCLVLVTIGGRVKMYDYIA